MIKTITARNEKEFDEQVNEYCKTHNVFATQTHMICPGEGCAITFIAILFTKEKEYNKS